MMMPSTATAGSNLASGGNKSGAGTDRQWHVPRDVTSYCLVIAETFLINFCNTHIYTLILWQIKPYPTLTVIFWKHFTLMVMALPASFLTNHRAAFTLLTNQNWLGVKRAPACLLEILTVPSNQDKVKCISRTWAQLFPQHLALLNDHKTCS